MLSRRKQLEKDHNHKYTRHYTEEGYKCFYCNDDAEVLDHVPALSWMDSLPYDKRRIARIPAILLPACTECNTALGARGLHLVSSRLEFLEIFYNNKFRRQSAMWTEEEISELGVSLQKSVRARQQNLNRYIDKIREIEKRALNVNTHPTWADSLVEDIF